MNSRSPEEFPDAGSIPPPPMPSRRDSKESDAVKRLREVIQGEVTVCQPETRRSSDLVPGALLGEYVLGEKLGSGAMGTVFEGQHQQSGERVAVKVLNATFARQKDALQRFQKEARILAETKSKHVTRLIEFDCDGPHHFIVTELVLGTTVERLIKEKYQLDEKTAVDIAIQTARALADLAEIDVLHRDVKPANILLALKTASESEYEVRLTDFGLARGIQQTGSMEITRANSVLGTPYYMSPEQFSDAKQIDGRSDLYSLGATLFHMLAGEPPFPSQEILELAELHRHSPPPDVRSLNSAVSDAVSEIIHRCLQKRSDLRYVSAEDLVADLRRVQLGEPIHLVSHPQIPECEPTEVLTFRYEWELGSSVKELWPYISNTERLNQAIGLPAIDYRTGIGRHGQAEVYAHVRILGIPMKWREHVYEWVEERRMGILREFDTGPLQWFISVVEFLPTASGRTRVIHSLKVLPNGWGGRLFARLKMGRATKKTLTRVYERIDAVLLSTHAADPAVDPFQATAAQTRKQKLKLQLAVDRLRTRDLSTNALLQISDYVAVAPAQDLGRIRPFALADRLNLAADSTLTVLMEGANGGLFELAWDVICPSCRIASQTYSLLKMVQDHEHCEACQLEYQVDFAKSVEVIFRAHANIRTVDTGKYCIGGPAHSPHVVAQIRLASGEQAELGLSLEDGGYRIQSPQLSKAMTFTVRRLETERPRGLKLQLDDAAAWSQEIILGGQQQLVSLVNSFDREVIVKVERTSVNQQVLTAADAIALPQFREMFPNEHFSHHQLATLTSLSILRTVLFNTCDADDSTAHRADVQRHFQLLSELCVELGGTWLKTTDDGVVIVFTDTEAAVRLVARIRTTLPEDSLMSIAATLSHGAVTTSMIGGRIDYFGDAVDRLAKRMILLQPNQCLADEEFAEDFRGQKLIPASFSHESFPGIVRGTIPDPTG